MSLEWYIRSTRLHQTFQRFLPKIPLNFSGLPPCSPRQTRPLFKIPLSRTASEAILVTAKGVEPLMLTR